MADASALIGLASAETLTLADAGTLAANIASAETVHTADAGRVFAPGRDLTSMRARKPTIAWKAAPPQA